MTTGAIYEALAKLQLGAPVSELERILGDEWNPPGKADKGYFRLTGPMLEFGPSIPFQVRVTASGTIGSLGFYREFPHNVTINGVAVGMPFEDVRAVYPAMLHSSEESSVKQGIDAYLTTTSDGDVLTVMVKDGSVLSLRYERPGSEYLGESPPKTYPMPEGIRAYDLEMLHREADRAALDNHGWVFGLPPGISAQQWPLDPISGYPLMHGFTVKLPEDYRVHGPAIVALSFFATAADQNDGGARRRDDLYAAICGGPRGGDDNPDLMPFRAHADGAHPRLHRMQDILDYEYAVILLTEAEFNGALCSPPVFAANPFLDETQRPRWMSEGSGHACFWGEGGYGMDGKPVIDGYIHRIHGAVPEKRLDWNRAISCTPRAEDPNAGLAPMDNYGEGPAPSGYLSYSYYEGDEISVESYREHEWAKGHKSNHIGGTMRPTQATPEFSPFYIEFDESFGGYNFGAGGNAQLDFLEMKFDWACG